MVPEGWTETYLGEVITHKKGFAFNSGSYRDKGIRIVRISDTTRNSVHSENPVYLAEEDANGLENYKLTKDDIILSTVGSRPHLLDSMVGKAVKVPLEADGSLLNQNLVKVIPKASKITNEYLYEMLKNNRFIFFISTLVRGNANQVSITLSDLFQYQFVLPPLPEQKKIAQILSAWDKAITTTEQLLANSQQRKKALMQQLLTGKKRLLDKNGVRFSGEWKDIRLKSVLREVKTRNKDNSIDRVLSVTNHSGFVLPEDQFSKRVASDDVSNYKVVKKGEYGYNPSRLNVGSFARLDSYEEGLLSPMYVVFSVNEKILNSDYFMNWMSSNEAKQRISGSTQGSVRDSVGFDSLCGFPFKLPPMEEQQKIASVLSTADQEISALQQKLDALKQEKKALMQQLLTGKRRVLVS